MLKVLATSAVLALSLSSFAQTMTEEKAPTIVQPHPVQRTNEYRTHFGINAGINNPEGSRGATPELGIDVGYQPYIPFGIGAELSTSRFDGADDEMHKRVTLLGRGTYNFGGETPVIRYSYVGLAAGPVFLHDGTEFGIAPVMGFDIPLFDKSVEDSVSLGFITKYLFVTSKDPDSLMTSAAVKWWY